MEAIKKVGLEIPLSDKVNSNWNFLRRDKEWGKSPNNLITVSMYTSNAGAPILYKKKLLKGTKCQICLYTLIVDDVISISHL